MNIGVDAYPLVKDGKGISVYLYNVLKNLKDLDLSNHYFLYTSGSINSSLSFNENSKWHMRLKKGFLSRGATLWMQTKACYDLVSDNIDIFWGPQGILPLNLSRHIKTVVTVHDLTYHFYPSTLKWNNRIIFSLFFKKSLYRATGIITDSETVADDLGKLFPEIADKIACIYPGLAQEYFKTGDKESVRSYISSRFGTLPHYILTVSTIEPRKNLEGLLEGFAQFKRMYPQDAPQLLIVGGGGWNNSSVYKTYTSLGFSPKEVRFLGYVSQKDLIQLYTGCEVFIFPSLYEGFGFPPLEAAASGTAVIASDIKIFHETLADAAWFVNPQQPKDIAYGLHHVLSNSQLKDTLIKKGFERVTKFCWRSTACKIYELFLKLTK